MHIKIDQSRIKKLIHFISIVVINKYLHMLHNIFVVIKYEKAIHNCAYSTKNDKFYKSQRIVLNLSVHVTSVQSKS